MKLSYTARAMRSGRQWTAEVPVLPGVYSAGKTLEEVETVTRDAIARVLRVGPDDFELRVVETA
jgi:predicted RNase H-like HicB family nuclease